MLSLDTKYHVRCARACGFIVGQHYFEAKKQFPAGLCPRCGAPVNVVYAYTEDVVPGVEMVKHGPNAGTIVEK